MEDNDLHPEPEPNEPDNEQEIDEEGNILNISQSSQSSHMGFPQTLQIQREIFILRGIISLRRMLKNFMSKHNACLTCISNNACNIKQSICFMLKS